MTTRRVKMLLVSLCAAWLIALPVTSVRYAIGPRRAHRAAFAV